MDLHYLNSIIAEHSLGGYQNLYMLRSEINTIQSYGKTKFMIKLMGPKEILIRKCLITSEALKILAFNCFFLLKIAKVQLFLCCP